MVPMEVSRFTRVLFAIVANVSRIHKIEEGLKLRTAFSGIEHSIMWLRTLVLKEAFKLSTYSHTYLSTECCK